MIAWLKRFLFDETAFVGLVRAVFFGLGAISMSGQLPAEITAVVPGWAGAALIAIGGFIRAGEKNPRQDAIATPQGVEITLEAKE